MVIKLQNADFSANNIGNIDISVLSEFTLDAITASGNTSMTAEQKSALENFFTAVGAKTNTGPWSKFHSIYLPIIAGDLSKAGVNYKDNTVDFTPSSSYYEMRNHGLGGNQASPSNNTCVTKSLLLDGKDLSVLAMLSENFDESFANSTHLSYQGDSGSDRFTVLINKAGDGNLNHTRAFVSPSLNIGTAVKNTPINIPKLLFGQSNVSGENKMRFLRTDGTFAEVTNASLANVGTDTSAVTAKLFGDGNGKALSTIQNAYLMLFIGTSLSEEELSIMKLASDTLASKF